MKIDLSTRSIWGILILFATGFGIVVTSYRWTIPFSPLRQTDSGPGEVVNEDRIRDFCGACHKVPEPGHLPRPLWPEEIKKGYLRFAEAHPTEFNIPDQKAVAQYFSERAPLSLVIPNAPQGDKSPLEFQVEHVDMRKEDTATAVSFLCTDRIKPGTRSRLYLCDMMTGWFHEFAWDQHVWKNSPLHKLKHPDHAIMRDYDRDGFDDVLLADLGTLGASDELKGGITLLHSQGDSGRFDPVLLQDGLGRVADVELADLDGDGDDDFIVAEFGFEKAGRLFWLETLSAGRPGTKLHVIDSRHGSIHAPPTDLDGDGDIDLIVLFSQEYEAIVGFENDGHGNFTPRTLFEANSPSFGSTGLELADLDGDGDLDCLFTNGDTLDKFQLRPFHGVHWLENVGNWKFDYHHLATLPGAVRAIAADLDSDGDLDIAAVAYCPAELRHQNRPKEFDTMIWLRQIRPSQFERHSLERSEFGHMSIVAGDFDGDNDLDLAVGEATFDPLKRRWFSIYWNLTTK